MEDDSFPRSKNAVDRIGEFQQFVGSMIALIPRMRPSRILECGVAISMLFAIGSSAQVLNDGTTVDRLQKITNANGFGSAQVELTSRPLGTNSVLQADLLGVPGDFSARTAWIPASGRPSGVSYTTSARFLPASAESERRGGVMGWLNLTTRTGIGFYVVPGEPGASFRVSTVKFLAESGSENESTSGLYALDGSAATGTVGSAWIGVEGYDASAFVALELQFSTPTPGDLRSVTNATAHISARVWQGVDGAGKPRQIGTTIELLTDLEVPKPEDHRVGYYAYNGSIFSDPGLIGSLDDLSGVGDFIRVNQPPSVSLTVLGSDGSPQINELVAPASILLSANALDSDGVVEKVDFFTGLNLVGTIAKATNGSAAVFNLNLAGLAAGTYAYTAKATDNQGATTTSAVATVTVKAPEPSGGGEAPLAFSFEGGKLTISWPEAYKGYILQTTSSLLPAAWKESANSAQVTSVSFDTSSGITFARLVKGAVVPEPSTSPRLTIAVDGSGSGQLVVSWPTDVSGYRLQTSATLLPGSWQPVGGTDGNSARLAAGGAQYFRLVRP